ncbi:MAG: MBL fold metallo-hydrolase [Gammaproteobacteria bacterium]|jgi:glyoxylase-like metal-dependent hydrolase (beta-lactamase superfamily II)|nr:MBL fold metallo-hydrolase [Chromatiales bacterium]MDP6673718.1 MBL fold metallo-hydrolase [Gammaproteobacteria bacterium]
MSKPAIRYAFDNKPDTGATQCVADGIYWLRMPLPFSIDHINLWLLEDGDGWVVVDTGLGGKVTKAAWEQIFSGVMDGRPIHHVIVTHMHPDHAGCAGWLVRRFAVDLWMTHAEYLFCRILASDTGREAPREGFNFYKGAGFDEAALERYVKYFGFFGKMIEPLPESFRRVTADMRWSIGDHEWRAIIGRGHSVEHACLYSDRLNVLISGDQLLPSISPNVSVWPTEPEANPLRNWLESLAAMKTEVPGDVLVLPAHGKPFYGAHERLDQIIGEHTHRLNALRGALHKPHRAVDTFAHLYKAKITQDNLIMATGEAIAHLHYLLKEGSIGAEPDTDGVIWYKNN